MKKYIEEILKNIPDKPGVYLMKDIFNEIIYVGKAISLKKRVRQYFSKSVTDKKVIAMVSNIDDIEFIVTNNEVEALVLENNLIKKNKPFYNILLRDDKTFPYIKITDEDYPRIFKTRNKADKNGVFFGPYTDVMWMNIYLKDIKEMFRIRDCNVNIEKAILNNERPCLNFHIGGCDAPCANKISKENYRKNVDKVIDFLKGNHSEVLSIYRERMNVAAQNLHFEEAAKYRDKINNIGLMKENQNIVLKKSNKSQHYISFSCDENYIVFAVLVYENGNMIKQDIFDFSVHIGEKEDLLASFLMQYYMDNIDIPKEVYIDFDIENLSYVENAINEYNQSNIRINSAKIGQKKDVLKLAYKNAVEQLKILQIKKSNKDSFVTNSINELESITKVKNIDIIESYDISNINGMESVGVKIVFKSGKKSPSDYRKYKINTVEGSDDYASMYEVIERRLKRDDFPDIILLDGGKGHVSTIRNLLSNYNVDIPVFGIYKDDKHKTQGLCDDKNIYEVDKRSSLYKLLSQIQEEVHRFAITFHRQRRNKNMLKSQLDDIEGVGDKRKLALLKYFGSIDGIKKADIDELIKVDGITRNIAENIYNFFR